MIERIYIPTVRRTSTQITYDNLPDELKKKVIMVVEKSERDLYNYDCEYIVLPDEIVGSYTQLSETRLFIHKHAGSIKYVVADDDIIIRRRNAKYWTGVSNMDTSSRRATPEEIIEMFGLFDEWLDEDDIGVVGPIAKTFAPTTTVYENTVGVFSFVCYDGSKLAKEIDDMDITCIRVAEDVLFIYECLSRGINTRASTEWLYENRSMNDKKLKETRLVWTDMYSSDDQPVDHFQSVNHYDALKVIRDKFPHGMKIEEKNGKMKNTKYWKKVYTRYLNDLAIKEFCERSLKRIKELDEKSVDL